MVLLRTASLPPAGPTPTPMLRFPFHPSRDLLEGPGMTPEIHRFLDLATRPLEGDPPLREAAKGELMARVGHAGVPFEMLDLAEPLELLEKAPPPRPWPRRIALLATLLFSLGTVLTATGLLAYKISLMSMSTMLSFPGHLPFPAGSAENPLLLDHVRRNAPELPLGREALSGKDGLTGPALWLARHPDDLAMWQEHAARQTTLRGGKEWTGFDEDTKEAIARLDADNALWPLMQLSALMASCIDPMTRCGSGTPTITDEVKFQNALRSFSDAAAQPRYHDRSWSLVRRQIDAFPPTGSLSDEVIAQGFTSFVTPPFDDYRSFGDGFGLMARIQCERLVASDHRDELRTFLSEWKNVVRLVLDTPEPAERYGTTILPQLAEMGEILSQSFGQLGMVVERAEAQEQLKGLPFSAYGNVPMPAELRKIAGLRLESYNTGVDDLTAEEVLPSRKTELAFFDRHVAIALAIIGLVFSGLVGLEACRRSKLVKGTAKGLMPLFRREDHLWIGGLGLGVPWLWWWVITRLTPLGLRGADPNELDAGMLALVLQPVTALVLAMVMLLQTARWRWAVRGGFLGLGGFLPWLGWAAAALTALAIPAAGMIGSFHLPGDDKLLYLLGVSGMAAFGLLWLLWEGIMNLFTPRASALRPNLVMRVLLPWTFAGIFSLIAAFGVSTFMERRWFAKDPLLPSWTSKTHRNAFEERRAEAWLKR